MKHFDTELRHLADNGYRSADEWLSLGREVVAGTAPRTTTTQRGRATALYTRHQTQVKPKAPRPARAPDAPAVVTPA